MQSMITFISLLAFISSGLCAVEFYPYGSGTTDSRLIRSADPAVTLTTDVSYVFFGEDSNHICISDNGYVTLENPLRTNKPSSFPITRGSYVSIRSHMIAPYWSDIDTRCGGDIFYRQVKLEPNDKLYGRIRDDVSRTGLASNFEPTSTIIVTWESVTPQNRIPCQDQKRNSFQLILTSDGSSTFTLFLYKSLEWHTSSAGRGPATAGANAGDNVNGFNLSNDPEDIKNFNLVTMSNVGVPGLFVYRIDLGPNPRVKAVLMGEMMAMAAAETMEFGVAEEELLSLHPDVAASEFNRQEHAHFEEYVGGLTAETQTVDFYTFDTPDSSTLGSSDEATSGRELLEKPICFFGKNYSSLVVYTNGFLTLGDFYRFPTYIPRLLSTTNIPIIAPFFADADTRGRKNGKIYYRQTDDSSLLSRAKQDIEFATSSANFSPEQLYIVTWDRIGFYNHHDDLLNSFQAVIATDGHTSYIIFIYKSVVWSSPDSTRVPYGTGVGAESSRLPIMGISDGKSVERLVFGSEEPRDENKILSVDSDIGNARTPGMWVFEASAATSARAANSQSHQRIDPKMRYSEYHQPSRPYGSTEQKIQSDIESLASELKNTHNYLG